MEKYVLQSNEVLLYESEVNVRGLEKSKVNFIITNLYFVTEITNKLGFRKYETTVEKYSVEDIKFYNDKPQIIQKKEVVTLYFTYKELEISLYSSFEASKLANKAIEAVTGKGTVARGAGSVKKAIGLVNETLGIDVIGTIAGCVENGVAGTLFKGIGKRSNSKKRIADSTETVSALANTATIVAKSVRETHSEDSDRSVDQRIDEVKKLKELLDVGLISQEEFDTKKKELLEL